MNLYSSSKSFAMWSNFFLKSFCMYWGCVQPVKLLPASSSCYGISSNLRCSTSELSPWSCTLWSSKRGPKYFGPGHPRETGINVLTPGSWLAQAQVFVGIWGTKQWTVSPSLCHSVIHTICYKKVNKSFTPTHYLIKYFRCANEMTIITNMAV